jgi:Flp pilus assembly pilin Flp
LRSEAEVSSASPRMTIGEDRNMGRLLIGIGRLARGDEGQDLIEYGLLAMIIAIGAMVAVGTVGNVINTMWWQYIATSF